MKTNDIETNQLTIRQNNIFSSTSCAICGAGIEPAYIDLFLADGWDLVCLDCGREIEPELVALLELHYAIRSYALDHICGPHH